MYLLYIETYKSLFAERRMPLFVARTLATMVPARA